jgi:uncharacterized membrane protein YjjB (DUF3815 family)
MTWATLLHQALFGGVAAAGFGVLFNFSPPMLLWCFASGTVALLVRTAALAAGWSLEAASFVAAGAVTLAAAGPLGRWLGPRADTVAVAGCIPMIPGAFLTQALLGLLALTDPKAPVDPAATVATVRYLLRVAFTLGGIGAGIAIPLHILRRPEF